MLLQIKKKTFKIYLDAGRYAQGDIMKQKMKKCLCLMLSFVFVFSNCSQLFAQDMKNTDMKDTRVTSQEITDLPGQQAEKTMNGINEGSVTDKSGKKVAQDRMKKPSRKSKVARTRSLSDTDKANLGKISEEEWKQTEKTMNGINESYVQITDKSGKEFNIGGISTDEAARSAKLEEEMKAAHMKYLMDNMGVGYPYSMQKAQTTPVAAKPMPKPMPEAMGGAEKTAATSAKYTKISPEVANSQEFLAKTGKNLDDLINNLKNLRASMNSTFNESRFAEITGYTKDTFPKWMEKVKEEYINTINNAAGYERTLQEGALEETAIVRLARSSANTKKGSRIVLSKSSMAERAAINAIEEETNKVIDLYSTKGVNYNAELGKIQSKLDASMEFLIKRAELYKELVTAQKLVTTPNFAAEASRLINEGVLTPEVVVKVFTDNLSAGESQFLGFLNRIAREGTGKIGQMEMSKELVKYLISIGGKRGQSIKEVSLLLKDGKMSYEVLVSKLKGETKEFVEKFPEAIRSAKYTKMKNVFRVPISAFKGLLSVAGVGVAAALLYKVEANNISSVQLGSGDISRLKTNIDNEDATYGDMLLYYTDKASEKTVANEPLHTYNYLCLGFSLEQLDKDTDVRNKIDTMLSAEKTLASNDVEIQNTLDEQYTVINDLIAEYEHMI